MVSAEHWYICSAWQKTGVSTVSGGRLVYLCCLVDDSESIWCLIVYWFIFVPSVGMLVFLWCLVEGWLLCMCGIG